MLQPRVGRLTPLVFLFALVQAMAPAIAAIADSWRVDQRAPYAHVESETESTCVVAHAHDCALCSVATSPTGDVRDVPTWCAVRASAQPALAQVVRGPNAADSRSASQRAPPGVRV